MRNSFKKLLESVKASCPEVITEEVFDGMMDQFDTGLAQVTADATAEGQALGFKEGYDEGKRVAAEQAKAELEALTEKLDAEAVEKLNSILQMIDENHTTKLQELYDAIYVTEYTNGVYQTVIGECAFYSNSKEFLQSIEGMLSRYADYSL